MPVLNFHLVEGQYSPAQCERLLLESSRFFAEVLSAPIDRVRVFITMHRPELFAVGGVLSSAGAPPAPYFTFITLEGRSLEDRQRLLRGFTDIIVEVLEVERGLVRGGIVPVAPENWAIGGEPASIKRAAEVSARAEAAKTAGP
jgi:phenylpyruvate tautomerase PptA (4-oxalocrotonate tautomerase family)